MLELTAHIDHEGIMKIANRDMLTNWVAQNKGRNIVLTVERKRKKRSNDQNAYWWGVVVPLTQEGLFHLGNEFTKEQTHELLKAQCNSKEIEGKDGLLIPAPHSTADLSTVEFMELIDRVQRWCAEYLGIVIPDPNEQLTL